MSPKDAPHSFLTTHWSLVHRAVSKDDPDAQAALAQLCGACWFPIYAYIRRAGKSPHDAEDLTQGFFARLLEKNFLASADGEKGRLRTFLLTCVQRHLADEHDRTMTQKRGGGRIVELDARLEPLWPAMTVAARRLNKYAVNVRYPGEVVPRFSVQ